MNNSVLTIEKRTSKSGYCNNQLIMSWDGFEALTRKISQDIIDYKELKDISFNGLPQLVFSGVFGLNKGGLILAIRLSNILGLPLLMAPARDCIVCTDISDTGTTLEKYTNSNYYTATLLMRDIAKPVPVFIGERVISNHWVEFPWEQTIL